MAKILFFDYFCPDSIKKQIKPSHRKILRRYLHFLAMYTPLTLTGLSLIYKVHGSELELLYLKKNLLGNL